MLVVVKRPCLVSVQWCLFDALRRFFVSLPGSPSVNAVKNDLEHVSPPARLGCSEPPHNLRPGKNSTCENRVSRSSAALALFRNACATCLRQRWSSMSGCMCASTLRVGAKPISSSSRWRPFGASARTSRPAGTLGKKWKALQRTQQHVVLQSTLLQSKVDPASAMEKVQRQLCPARTPSLYSKGWSGGE